MHVILFCWKIIFYSIPLILNAFLIFLISYILLCVVNTFVNTRKLITCYLFLVDKLSIHSHIFINNDEESLISQKVYVIRYMNKLLNSRNINYNSIQFD